MKILIASLNSKYVHTNIAIRYLKKYIDHSLENEVQIADYTINQNKDEIIRDIYNFKPDLIAFSIYIWNLEMSLNIIRKIKKILPDLILVVGGPEVSYNPKDLLENEISIDYLITGEGEIPFRDLVTSISIQGDTANIPGVCYRKNDDIIINEQEGLMDISNLLFPYDIPFEQNKLIYYETSRGCPYNCSYCISSTIKGVRFKDLSLVKEDLKRFIDEGVKIVKFVDRTFNVDKNRSFEIIKFIKENDRGKTTFHMELSPHLIDEDWIEMLKGIRKDLVQFEIGIQSVNDRVITEVNRKIFYHQYENKIKSLIAIKNIHIHVDLIAGLPFENYDAFIDSFDRVYGLKADLFQLGFLKLLKGSALRQNHRQYGYVFDDEAPYEVISNNVISYAEIIKLKEIEELLELYYNSHHFEKSIEYIIELWEKPSQFYKSFAQYWNDKGYFDQKHQLIHLFEYIYEFQVLSNLGDMKLLKELLKFDYFKRNRYKTTAFFGNILEDFNRQSLHEFLQEDKNIERDLSQFTGMKVKEILKSIQVIPFSYNILLDEYVEEKNMVYFDYKNNKFGIIRMGVEDE